MRKPASLGRFGSMKAAEARREPMPKNQMQVRIETQQQTIKKLEADKEKLLRTIENLLRTIEENLTPRLPKKLAEKVEKYIAEIRVDVQQ